MHYKLNKWAIAFRKKDGTMLDGTTNFQMLKHNYKGFYADPFLFEYQGETYLFAEYESYKVGRGTIVYAKYDKTKDTFGDFKEIISEEYHLSYPLILEHNGEIYLMPEASGSNSLYIYKAKRFPDLWEKAHVLIDDIKLVDTTPFVFNNHLYAFSKDSQTPESPMLLLKIDTENWSILDKTVVTDDMSFSRPGGNVFEHNGEYYMVTQDCKGDYGKALNILRFKIDKDNSLKYKMIKKITPDKVNVTGIKSISGIHTYNFTDELEVIDFKYPKSAFYRRFWKLMRRMGICRK